MTNRLAFEALLSGVEAQLDAIAQALGGQDPEQLEACSQALRDVTLQLTRIALPTAQEITLLREKLDPAKLVLP